MKYNLKVFKNCDVRYIPVSKKVFEKISAICWLAGNGHYKCVNFFDLDLDLQQFIEPFFD